MDSFAKFPVRYTKNQRTGFFVLLLIVVCVEFNGLLLTKKIGRTAEIPFEVNLLTVTDTGSGKKGEIRMVEFDPNELDAKAWENLGFSEKQSATILKYKYSLGGFFSSKEQLQNCFVISKKKFEEIETFIVFNKVQKHNNYAGFASSSDNGPKINYRKFNPNDYTQKDWQNIGFSEKQAASILKYKNSLGGSFTSIKQIESCFMISEKKFNEMKPYIVISTKTADKIEIRKTEGNIRLVEMTEEEEKPTTDSYSIRLVSND